jgi:hypothetical protein
MITGNFLTFHQVVAMKMHDFSFRFNTLYPSHLKQKTGNSIAGTGNNREFLSIVISPMLQAATKLHEIT